MWSSSVLGIISIPGMMTGAILGGSSVQQAARLQMIIMFMITASTTLATILITIVAITVCVDYQHRVRSERITKNHDRFYWVTCGFVKLSTGLSALWRRVRGESPKETKKEDNWPPAQRRPAHYGKKPGHDWMGSVKSTSIRRWYYGEDASMNENRSEEEQRPDERTRLLA